MRSLLDINVLIALFQPAHAHHERAHEWWMANRAEGWASCPLTQNGFVRIASQPSVPGAVTTADAMAGLDAFVARTDHAFWPDDISLLDTERFKRDHILGPKQITDIYLLALAVKHGGRLATLDETIPLGAVHGAQMHHLAVI